MLFLSRQDLLERIDAVRSTVNAVNSNEPANVMNEEEDGEEEDGEDEDDEAIAKQYDVPTNPLMVSQSMNMLTVSGLWRQKEESVNTSTITHSLQFY